MAVLTISEGGHFFNETGAMAVLSLRAAIFFYQTNR